MTQLWKQLACIAGVLASNATFGAEATLRAVSAWPEGNVFSKNFERFIEKVNAEGKGLVQIKYLGGGAKVMPPFEVGNAVKAGIVDIANVTGNFYANLVPESDALSLSTLSAAEQRKNGAMAYVNALWNQKMNAVYLAKSTDGMPYHIFLKKPITKPDLTGLRLRGIPIYKDFFESMNGSVTTLPPGELYTALERGAVDGFGWPLVGIFDLALQEHTKYRVDPGFYNVEIGVLVSLNAWKKLDDKQREFLQKQGIWMELLNASNAQLFEEERKKQAAAGIKTIELTGADRAQYLAKANAIWDRLVQRSPEHGPKLKALLSR